MSRLRLGFVLGAALAVGGCGATEDPPVAAPGAVERLMAEQERKAAVTQAAAIRAAEARGEAQAKADLKQESDAEAAAAAGASGRS